MPYPTYYEYITSDHRETADRYVFMMKHIGQSPFEELLRCCHGLSRGLIRKYYLEGYDRADLEQEARMILVEALQNYKWHENLSFMQYFHLCLQNHLNKSVRKQQALKRKATHYAHSLERMSDRSGVSYECFLPKYLEEPCAIYCTQESYRQYRGELSPIEEDVFRHFIAGMSYQEICETLELDLGMMKRALYRCSAKLRKIIRNNH
ncbi:sigma-70 family RNA polymerase sigma factor [Allofustis seminis]|uniref:sigma-70 family RNA polymerase sigma factor n=1 Tax=Allofustis seminis TaxID=166939 RepID=UPI00036EE1F0|nr:sigma-70 family RNA polymerase sigma factor [Allofustis seminis]